MESATQTPATDTPAAPADPSTDSAAANNAPLSRITGRPIDQAGVDALYDVIDKEVRDRTTFLRTLKSARVPLGVVHHGIGAYVVVCEDGTAWRSHGEDWEQLGKPLPGSKADLLARQQEAADKAAAERAASAQEPPAESPERAG